MNAYVRVSNELYDEFETAANKDIECEFSYLNDENEVNIKTKIVKLKNIEGTEYMDIEEGKSIRLDKIVSFNGLNTKVLNHY